MTGDDPTLVRRAPLVLRADPRRVITQPFTPGKELLADGDSRADVIVNRVMKMSDEDVSDALATTLTLFGDRHRNLPAILAEHFWLAGDAAPSADELSPERRDLIGAYFTKELSVEAAALFNPSAVLHPDQRSVADGAVRVLLGVRAVGEGHVSSLEFRSGVFPSDGDVRIDTPHPRLTPGRVTRRPLSRELLRRFLVERGSISTADGLLSRLPDVLSEADLDAALAAAVGDGDGSGAGQEAIAALRVKLSASYRVEFAPDIPLSERVLYPASVDESHGIEDARLTRFTDDDGTVSYFATYTAFDGFRIAPHLARTEDFLTFDVTPLFGPAAKDKGMAMFPRRVGGHYMALTRWDQESIGVAGSRNALEWDEPVTLQSPREAWTAVQIGNCGPPIETAEGWLLLTHGVGPMRTYGIGAMLLDLEDPTRVLGSLPDPILTPEGPEREGYVPNVVYSCGGLVHDDTLLIPYGCSDSCIRFAYVDLPQLLERLRASGPRR